MTGKSRRKHRAPKDLAPVFSGGRTRDSSGALFVLGPSEYAAGSGAHRIPAKPRDVRESLVDYIGQVECKGVMMELVAQQETETNSELFDRILDETPVSAFLVYCRWVPGSMA